MGIFDLLRKLGGGGQADAPSDPQAPGGVAQALGAPADSPQPQPPAAPSPQVPTPSTPPSTDQGLGGFLSHIVSRATARDPATQMSFMDKLGQLGGAMTDMGGETQGAEAQWKQEAAQRQAGQQRQRLGALAQSLNLSPREQLVFQADPEAWVKANAQHLFDKPEKATPPHVVAAKDGIYTVDPATGETKKVQDFGPQAEPGWNANPDGSWSFVPGGPHDPATIAREAGTRRDQVVKRPMPSRARPAAAMTGLPPGYVAR